VLAVLRSWLEFTGVPGVIEVSSEIWRDQLRRELDRIEEMVRRGEQPSAIWSSLRQWTISLTRVAGAVTGVSSILEAGDEYLGLLAAQLERPPGDLDALVRARSAKLLALLEEELAGLRGLRDQVAALVAEARPPVDEMKKAALRLWTGRFRLEEARRNIRTLRELCEDARERRARIDAEEPAFARAIGEARRALAALERAAEEACAAASSGRSPGRAREAGAAAAALAGSAAEDAERMLAGLREPARRLAEDLPKLRRLLDTTSPRTAAALLAITLEETRSAGERASGPLEAALFLGAGVEERLARIERRAELLIHAGAAAERCRALVEEARRVQGELEGAGARRLGLEVNGAVSQAYEDWGAARGVDVEPLQREWERACPEPPAAFDPATIDAKERELRDVRDAAERARVRLDECTGRASVAVARPELYTTRDAEGTRREQVFSAGESLFLQVELAVERLAEPTAARVQAAVTRPDGRRVELREASVDLVPGTERYRVPFPLRVGADASAGTYAAEATVRVADRSSPRGTAGFEVRGRPIEAMRLTVTDGPDSDREASPFRPADPIGFRLRYRGQGPPGRALRVRLEVRGPDPGASRLGGEWSEELLEGDRVSARGGALPEVLLEGTYTAVAHVSVEGGAEEAVPAGFEVKYPVEITEVRLMDEQDAPRSEYAPGAPFRWLMQFRFQNTRPGDRFASFLECRAGDARIDALSSPIYGPDPVNAESGWTLHTGTIPEGLPPGRYVVVGGVDLAGGRYLSRPVAFAVTSGAEVAITSPANGFRVSEKVLALTGTCSDRRLTEGVMVTNGQAVPIKLSNGRFEAKTVLRPGANRIQIGVRTPAGDRWAEVGGTADIAAAALKVVLSWQAQTADVDLWVHDPEREVTNYQRKRPAAGARSLDVDDTNGPGMETYTIEKPLRGRYVVAVHYYSAHSWRGPVPVSVQITRWEGTQSESHETRVGTLTVAAGNDNRPGAVVWFEVDL
jgi:hypothetical protein